MRSSLLIAVLAIGVLAAVNVQAAANVSDGVVKVGVLTDMSGPYKTDAGPGSVLAAQLAIVDFGGKVLGKPIKLVSADHREKPGLASSIARKWIDTDDVDTITGMVNSAVGLAVQKLASDKRTITMNVGSGSIALTETQCTKYGIHYAYDTHALAAGTATAIVKNGGKDWFFIAADYAFGHSLENSATQVLTKLGGTVVGHIDAPLGTNDFSSYLLQAQNSGADVIALANAGGDMVNTVKQAHEFGIGQRDQQLAALIATSINIKALGINSAQGLEFTVPFYWNRTSESRQWSQRFYKQHGAMPNWIQAGVYSAVTTYLKAVKTAGTDDADAVRKQLGEMSIHDFFAENGHIEPNGLMEHDMYLAKVKTPAESKGPWDLAKIISVIPGEKAYIPLSKSACPLLHQQ